MMKRQATAFALAALLLLLLSPVAHASVESICKTITKKDPTGIVYHFCVKTLKSIIPEIDAVNVRGLAFIATKLSSIQATHVTEKIKELLKSSQDNAEKESLSTCNKEYSNLIDNLDSALSAIKESRKDDAVKNLSSSADAPRDCEKAFKDTGAMSPLEVEDGVQRFLSAIALGITKLI
ncbi:uncharacterized protein LOC122033940 [Zingiber officinale]|uniref:Pectinesterase inhibitor domain-containing protein n=1 Tax=Zingiber officinale TaxID=94328 RepID=A0A8J5EMB0_ZINOF|nr:uncharacterized protein LOC122033940 [Zingiber officinale]KAG6468598.1 hypothetical protein ZIOFF_073286 [Zingiber officinale]